MKMQKYIRIILSLILIVSNLSVAFSMHFCSGQIEQIKLNHLDNKVCKMQKPSSCCAEVEEKKHCETPINEEEQQDEDCCQDLAYSDDIQKQQIVKVLKVTPIVFQEFPFLQIDKIQEVEINRLTKLALDSYVECNSPPIYKLNHQLIFYEA